MDNEKQKSIGKRIRAAREEVGLSQEQLGAKVGYSAMGISHLENGDRQIKIDDLGKIAQVLGVGTAYFLEPITGIPARYPSTTYGRIEEDLNDNQKREVNEALEKFDQYVESLNKNK